MSDAIEKRGAGNLSTMSPLAVAGSTALALVVMAAGVWAILPSAPKPKTTAGPARRRIAGGDVKTDGLLAAAVQDQTYDTINWVDTTGPGGLTITVAADLLKASTPDGALLRLPASYDEDIQIAKNLTSQLGFGVIVPSQQIADAIYRNATVRTNYNSLVMAPGDSLHMQSVDFSKKYNADIDDQIAKALNGPPAANTLVSGAEKYWILHERLDPKKNADFMSRSDMQPAYPQVALNYGGWKNGVTLQTVGGQHNYEHTDYSQLFRPIKRWAVDASGNPVDLLAWIEQNERVPSQYTDAFRFDVAA